MQYKDENQENSREAAFDEQRPGLFGCGKKEIDFLISDHPVPNLRVTGLDNSLSDFVRQAVCFSGRLALHKLTLGRKACSPGKTLLERIAAMLSWM